MSIGWLIVAVVIFLVSWIPMIYLAYKRDKQRQEDMKKIEEKLSHPLIEIPPQPPPQVNVNMRPMEDAINALPNKVLQSIQSSVNTRKGALGELIGYIELEATYDRIIPLGNIVDFMCIKFPSEENEGCVDFVDIKTGKSSRLSKEQRLLQQLIKDKKINFVKLKVNTTTSENYSDQD